MGHKRKGNFIFKGNFYCENITGSLGLYYVEFVKNFEQQKEISQRDLYNEQGSKLLIL